MLHLSHFRKISYISDGTPKACLCVRLNEKAPRALEGSGGTLGTSESKRLSTTALPEPARLDMQWHTALLKKQGHTGVLMRHRFWTHARLGSLPGGLDRSLRSRYVMRFRRLLAERGRCFFV